MGKRTTQERERSGDDDERSKRQHRTEQSETITTEAPEKQDPVARSSRSVAQNRISHNTRREVSISSQEVPESEWSSGWPSSIQSHFVFARERDSRGRLQPSRSIQHLGDSPALREWARYAYAERIVLCPSCYTTSGFVRNRCEPGEPGEPCRTPKIFDCTFNYKGLRRRTIDTWPEHKVTEVYYHEVENSEGQEKEKSSKRFKEETVTIWPDDYTEELKQEVEAVMALSELRKTEELSRCLGEARRKKEEEVNLWQTPAITPENLFPKPYQVGRFVERKRHG